MSSPNQFCSMPILSNCSMPSLSYFPNDRINNNKHKGRTLLPGKANTIITRLTRPMIMTCRGPRQSTSEAREGRRLTSEEGKQCPHSQSLVSAKTLPPSRHRHHGGGDGQERERGDQ